MRPRRTSVPLRICRRPFLVGAHATAPGPLAPPPQTGTPCCEVHKARGWRVLTSIRLRHTQHPPGFISLSPYSSTVLECLAVHLSFSRPRAPLYFYAPSPSIPSPLSTMSEKYGVAPTAAQVGDQYRQELMAQCAQGRHQVQKKYGVCGIICAVCLFPIGLFCLLCDVKKTCARCGEVIA